MNIKWKFFPEQIKFQYHDTYIGKLAKIVADSCFDRSIYVCSWFTGIPGTKNDLKFLAVSPFLTDIL